VASGFRIEYGPPVPVASITPLDQRVDTQNAIGHAAAAIELDGPVGEMVELRRANRQNIPRPAPIAP
jgi:hypothetical protein